MGFQILNLRANITTKFTFLHVPSELILSKQRLWWACCVCFFFCQNTSPRHIILNWRILHQKNWKIKILQTAKKISTSTKFHLWDVLKLKKRIIFHFRLFCSTFGHLKKKVQNVLKNSKNLIFLKFKILICDESAGNRLICGRKVGSAPKSPPKIFYAKRTKIDEFISKKHTPSQKGLFLEGGREIGGR